MDSGMGEKVELSVIIMEMLKQMKRDDDERCKRRMQMMDESIKKLCLGIQNGFCEAGTESLVELEKQKDNKVVDKQNQEQASKIEDMVNDHIEPPTSSDELVLPEVKINSGMDNVQSKNDLDLVETSEDDLKGSETIMVRNGSQNIHDPSYPRNFVCSGRQNQTSVKRPSPVQSGNQNNAYR